MQNVITWFDIPTSDFDRAVRFYSDILGVPVKASDHMGQKLGIFPMEGQEGVGGCIVPPGTGHVPSATGTRVYINCAGKLDDVLTRIDTAGGKILQPKFSIGQPGWIAVIQDTEGNTVGLHSAT